MSYAKAKIIESLPNSKFFCKDCEKNLKNDFHKCEFCNYKVSKYVLAKKNAAFKCNVCDKIMKRLI